MQQPPFQLSTRQGVQTTLLYYFASLDYLKGLQQRLRDQCGRGMAEMSLGLAPDEQSEFDRSFEELSIYAGNIDSTMNKHQKPSDLAAYNSIYAASLQQSKGEYLYIAAKAKTLEARPSVEKMALQPEWRDEPERRAAIQIAQAALGNTQIEDGFIDAVIQAKRSAPPAPPNRFYNVGAARDGTELAKRLEPLGLIGTRRSLGVVCSYLRSPLKNYVRDVSERSVRYAALSALLYNFPDERLLARPIDLAGWSAAEQFCSKNIGAVFDGPTPDIPLDQAYPIMMPARK